MIQVSVIFYALLCIWVQSSPSYQYSSDGKRLQHIPAGRLWAVCSGGKIHGVMVVLAVPEHETKFWFVEIQWSQLSLNQCADFPWSKIAHCLCQEETWGFSKSISVLFFFFSSELWITKSHLQHFITHCNYSSDYENDRYLIKICEICSQQEMRISSPNCNFLLSWSTFQGCFLTMWHFPPVCHSDSPQ